MFAFANKKTRIFYHPKNFATGLAVTGFFILPNDDAETTEELQFIEIKDGVYYLDYTFVYIGKYGLVAKEDGECKHFEIFKVGYM